MDVPEFQIACRGQVSKAFKQNGIEKFSEACSYIKHLRYGRNANKENLLTIFSDGYGTCSTKHALLKQLADENDFADIRLMLGIYKMSGDNTPPTRPILERYELDHIPEAHNYLRYRDVVIDCTAEKPLNFIPDLLEEIEITPGQVTTYKINYHRQYLDKWLKNRVIKYNLEELWAVREACIAALAGI